MDPNKLLVVWILSATVIYVVIEASRLLVESSRPEPGRRVSKPLPQWDAYHMATVTGSRLHQPVRVSPPEHRDRETVVIDHEYQMARLARATGRWDNVDELLQELGADG